MLKLQFTMLKTTLLLGLVGVCLGDLRMASQPKKGWKVQQRNRNVPFQVDYALYMEPSDFGYEGLKKQRDGGGYDNFLRSNIDNEQDRRNFNTEPGRDHLPFRSYETANMDNHASVYHKMDANSAASNKMTVTPGTPFVIPLRWNNPHSAELEVNIWIMNKGTQTYVVPITRPVCSGEGYQDNVFTSTVPMDFNSVASCKEVGDCILQVYAHSVESRMYASGTPLIVTGGTGAFASGSVQEAETEVGYDVHKLRRLCLPRSEGTADIRNARLFKARLSSDQYNHAYQNSDFSPYAGQQPKHISANMQASCILKMATGNFGELGKQYMNRVAPQARWYAKKLDKKARGLVRIYETATNAIIEAIKYDQQNNGTMTLPKPANAVSECTNWKDYWQHKAHSTWDGAKFVGGRDRGTDRTGGYCPSNKVCWCRGNKCYGKDAICVEVEPDGKERCEQKMGNDGKYVDVKDSNGKCVNMVPAGTMKIKAGTEEPRLGKSPQKTETCFRCSEVGSTVTNRKNTNTYIPSFEIAGVESINMALERVAPIYLKSGFLTHPDTGAITKKGDTKAILQLYMAVLNEMWPEFAKASSGSYLQEYYESRYNRLKDKVKDLEKFKFSYRGPVLKETTTTLADERNYIKTDASGKNDRGYYAAQQAWPKQAKSTLRQPDRDGPLKLTNGKGLSVVQSVNMAANKHVAVPYKSPKAPSTFKIPPDQSTDVNACSKVPANAVFTDEITEENEDMDGLNADADCDDDAVITAQQKAHDEMCEKEEILALDKGETYVCPPYPEPVCKIPGQGGLLPGQLFTNDEDYLAQGLNPASTVTVSASAALLTVAAALFL